MSTTRQNKVSRLLQRDLSEIFQRESAAILAGKMISVTNVRVTVDLSLAKVYLSIFPSTNKKDDIKSINEKGWLIKQELVKRIKNQVKSMPELNFYLDDSLDYIENIENLLE